MVLILGLLSYRFAKRATAEQAIEWICRAGIWLSLISIVGYVVDVLGIAPGLGFAYRGSPILGQFGDAPRMTGLHLDPNYFAQNMSIYSVTTFVFFLFVKLDIRLRRLVVVCFVLTTLCVLASLSRGGIIGIVVGIALLAMLNLRRTVMVLLRRKWLLLITGVSFVVLMSVVIPAEARYFAVERLQGTYLQEELQRMNRLDLWRASWDMFIDHPLLGVGLGNTILLEQYYKYGWAIQIPHNTPLEVLTETGILGFLAYIWLIGSIFGTGWKSMKRAIGRQRILLMGLLLAFVVAFVQSQFLSAQYEPALWGLWGVLLGTAWRAKRGLV